MDVSRLLSEWIDGILSFAQSHTLIAILIGLILLYLLCRRPKLFFGLTSLFLILVFLFYLIANLATSGSERKKRLVEKEQTQSDGD